MATTVIASPTEHEAAQPAARRPAISRRLAGILLAYFLFTGVFYGYDGAERMSTFWTWLNDLHYFYEAGEIIFSDYPPLLYDPDGRVNAGLSDKPGQGSPSAEMFPYPATVAALFWPLTLLTLEDARWVVLGVSIGCFLAIAVIAGIWSKDPLLSLLVAASTASLLTVYEVLRFSQIAPIVALIGCVAMLALAGKGIVRAGVLAGLLAIKPSLGALPLALVAWRRKDRVTAVAAATGFAIFFAIPFFLIGIDGLVAYAEQLSLYRKEAFHLDGFMTAGAGWMMNLNAFVGKLLGRDPPLYLLLPCYLLTVFLMLKTWSRGSLYESWFAASLASLLLMPHAVWYDWVVLFGSAPFAVYARRSMTLLVLVLALHFAINFDSYRILSTASAAQAFLPTTAVSLLILGFLAFGGKPVRWFSRQARQPELRPATAMAD